MDAIILSADALNGLHVVSIRGLHEGVGVGPALLEQEPFIDPAGPESEETYNLQRKKLLPGEVNQ